MNHHHYRTLEWIDTCGSVSEYDGYTDEIPFLSNIGFLRGEWFGSLDYPPSKRWRVTTEGLAALKQYKREVLIASTPQCLPPNQCKGKYGTEVYPQTDCITCGRTIYNKR